MLKKINIASVSLFIFSSCCFAGSIALESRLPGTSIADKLLQSNALFNVYVAAAVKVGGNCRDLSAVNTALTKKPQLGKNADGSLYVASPWEEVWTVKACGKYVDVPITFIPNRNTPGTTFAINQNDVRLK